MRTIQLLCVGFLLGGGPTILLGQSGLDDDHWDCPVADPRINRDVYALAATDNGKVYVGGFFGGSPGEFNRIACWDGRGWSKLGAGTTNGVDYTLNAIVASGGDIYAGGEFGSVYTGPVGQGYVVHEIAKWDGQQWSRLGDNPAFGVTGDVYALAMDGTNLYVGGRFMAAGGISLTNIAKWNGQE